MLKHHRFIRKERMFYNNLDRSSIYKDGREGGRDGERGTSKKLQTRKER